MAFLLNSQAQAVSGKNEQSTQTPWRGAQCSCVGCIDLRSALSACLPSDKRVINQWFSTCLAHGPSF